jgi:hypothetical protein
VSDPRCHLLKAPGLALQLQAPGFHEDTTRKIKVESKEDVKKRTGQPSGNLADALLQTQMVHIGVTKPMKKPESSLPPAFEKHFKRLRKIALLESGIFIG